MLVYTACSDVVVEQQLHLQSGFSGSSFWVMLLADLTIDILFAIRFTYLRNTKWVVYKEWNTKRVKYILLYSVFKCTKARFNILKVGMAKCIHDMPYSGQSMVLGENVQLLTSSSARRCNSNWRWFSFSVTFSLNLDERNIVIRLRSQYKHRAKLTTTKVSITT